LIWAFVAAFFARQHHVRTPEPIPDDTGWRRRPKWARRARPDPQEHEV
jgi:hypothetical protein